MRRSLELWNNAAPDINHSREEIYAIKLYAIESSNNTVRKE